MSKLIDLTRLGDFLTKMKDVFLQKSKVGKLKFVANGITNEVDITTEGAKTAIEINTGSSLSGTTSGLNNKLTLSVDLSKTVKDKLDSIPTKVSELQNDTGYLTQHQSLDGYAKTSDVEKKVDKEVGKGLSTNDYTTTEKNKLGNYPESLQYVTQTDMLRLSSMSKAYTTFYGMNLGEYICQIPEVTAENIKSVDIAGPSTKVTYAYTSDKKPLEGYMPISHCLLIIGGMELWWETEETELEFDFTTLYVTTGMGYNTRGITEDCRVDILFCSNNVDRKPISLTFPEYGTHTNFSTTGDSTISLEYGMHLIRMVRSPEQGWIVDTRPFSASSGATPMETVSTTTKELSPNTLYVFGVVNSLNLTLATGKSGQVNEYMFEFTANANDITITLPSTVKWMSAPSIKQGYTYQVSIVNNLAVIGGWNNE